jgi:hypothetical protein
MLFSMHAIDRPDAAAKRQEVHVAHTTHLKAAKDFGVTIVMGGPLMSDDGKGAVGSLMLLEAADRKTVEAFNNADPFAKGVWASVQINRFDKRQG